ncbi:MAG: hypothetical protein ACRDKZ_05205 [Actinomycetota bacterium]
MIEIAGFPYLGVEFTKDGTVHKEREVEELLDGLGEATDLIVLAHGWNNDMQQARRLYENLLGTMRKRIDAGGIAGLENRSFAVLGILWPSKKFADEDFIAGGAASLDVSAAEEDLQRQLEDLKGVFDDPEADAHLESAKALVGQLESSEQARDDFAALIKSSLSPDKADDEDASDTFFELPGRELMARLATPTVPADETPAPGGGGAATMGGVAAGGAAGGAAGIGDFFADMKAAARSLLNFATYYQMKARAGEVGSKGVNDVLRRVKAARPEMRLHLAGHSFGGRLVAAAVLGPEDKPAVLPNSLTLLQAAFSHFGFADDYQGEKDGFFRPIFVKKMISGPLVVTHTDNDKAVGIAYPMASRIARQVASGLGDKNDLYGGIGRNGAQKTPEATAGELLAAGQGYDFKSGKVYNLKADKFISDHSDVTGSEVAHALLSAIGST